MTLSTAARALWGASHPGPSVVVTVLAVALGLAAGLPPWRLALLATAVLAGQLSVGISNDAIDARRDRAVGRADKPIARGDVSVRVAWGAAVAMVALALVLSLLTGLWMAVAHAIALASAWAYNAGLKNTALSIVPFVVSFGLFPSLATLAAAEPAPAAPWATVAGAALGAAVHLTNVLPDLDDDARTGVRGLPHRLGERRSRLLAASLLTGASAVLAATGRGLSARGRGALLALNTVLAGVAVTGAGRAPFRAASAMALLDAVALVAEGHAIPAPVPARTATAKRTVAGTGSG